MSVSEIDWSRLVKVLGQAGIIATIGVLIYLVRPDRTAFGLKGPEVGLVLIVVAVAAAILLDWGIKE